MSTSRLAGARLFCVWAFAPFCAFAQNASTSGTVMLKSTSQSSASIAVGQTNTLTAVVANTGGSVVNILVDLELIDSAGHRVDQKFFDNQPVSSSAPAAYYLTTAPGLPEGDYYFSVGLFRAGWSSLIGWNNAVQRFTVSGGAGSPGGSPSDVTVDSTALGEFHLNNCPQLTVLLANRSSSAQTVLVDIELKDSGGNKVSQEFFDSFAVPATPGNIDASVSNHCGLKLADGTYSYAVGIFSPHWGSLAHWYDNIRRFEVRVNPQQPDVILQGSAVAAANINPGQSNTLTATLVNTGPENRQVLVDLELVGAGNARVDQKFFNPVTLAPDIPVSFSLVTSSGLGSGTYRFSVGVFNPNWTGLIRWYDAVQAFTVSGSPSGLSSITLVSAGVSQPFITEGHTTTVSGTIRSNNAPANNTIVELTIFDETNKSRFMEAHSGQTLTQDQPTAYSIISPANLPAGTYRTQLAVYDSTHTTALAVFSNIGAFVVQ